MTNTATVAVPPGDTTPGNNSCHRQRQPDAPDRPGHHQDRRPDQAAVPGTSTTYTIVVSNAGPARRHRAALSDPLPAGVTAATWTFVAARRAAAASLGPLSGSALCPPPSTCRSAATVTFSFTAAIDPTATGTLTNIATVTPPRGRRPAAATPTR